MTEPSQNRAVPRACRVLFVPACALTFLLVACSSNAPIDTTTRSAPTAQSTQTSGSAAIDPAAAKNRTVAAGRIVPIALGSAEWKLVRGPFAHHCPDIGTQLQFEWDAHGPGSTNVSRDAKTVSDAYEKAGFQIGLDRHSASDITVLAHSDASGDVEFDAKTTGSRVVAVSDCLAGDPSNYPTMSPEPPTPHPTD